MGELSKGYLNVWLNTDVCASYLSSPFYSTDFSFTPAKDPTYVPEDRAVPRPTFRYVPRMLVSYDFQPRRAEDHSDWCHQRGRPRWVLRLLQRTLYDCLLTS